jgi:hypothetical protein
MDNMFCPVEERTLRFKESAAELQIRSMFNQIRIQQIQILKIGSGLLWNLP